jgi:lysophospholipase L1-like esterase
MLHYRSPVRSVLSRPALGRVWVGAVAALALVASGCNAQASDPEQPRSDVSEAAEVVEVTPDRYVALGDSYTAAPLRLNSERVKGCMRSRNNYPRLVVDALENTELVDVSCSGASTISMFSRQGFDDADKKKPPQLDALTADTDLVTVSIGANDFRLFNSMIFECLDVGPVDPDGAPCREQNTQGKKDRLKRTIRRIEPRVRRVVEDIRERAPEARVLLVGYPKLLPDTGVCPRRLPLARGDYGYARHINRRLTRAVRNAGTAAGAEYLNLFRASMGHDICSDEPWIAGIRGVRHMAMGLHPYPSEQRAVADLILAQLELRPGPALQRGVDHSTVDNG